MTTRKPRDWRIWVIQVLLVLWVGAIGWKLVRLQVRDHDWLLAKAERQQQATIDLSPMRGVIFDRNGSELARSVEVKSLYASPSDIGDPEVVADKLSAILDIDRDALFDRLTSQRVLVAVKRKLTDREYRLIEQSGIQGLRFFDEMKRYYVAGSTAAHVLGFVDIDEKGSGGIELAYDRLIRGRGGRLQLDVDALKKSYDHSFEQAQPGANVTLTIDTLIQHYAELALATAVHSSHARGGTIVMIRPQTGEILALASYPTFNPNQISESSEETRSNRAVENLFEPGSIFKLVTYSAALEEQVVRPDSRIECDGQIKVFNQVVHDGVRGVLTASQALAKSSNVAAIKIAMQLGNDRLSNYIERFGFGRKTGLELPAESRGLVRPLGEWTPTSVAAVPIGHEVGVTAVQAAAAFACIANGGEWIQPHIVSRVTTASGEVLDEPMAERRRVVSEKTASTLKSMLEGVVLRGTGKAAQLSGYRAAGKTGTAQKINENTGRYSQTHYFASFAGFAPVASPEIACVVSIDDPVGAHHGGDVAAPVFARVVSDALRLMGVPPDDQPESTLVAGDLKVYEMRSLIKENDFARAAREIDARPVLEVASVVGERNAASNDRGEVMVPDLVGRGMREAIAICAARGLRLEASGDGVVAEQSPRPGVSVSRDAICTVRLAKSAGKRDGPEGPRAAAKTF
ncbi:MAG TPA: penicillin-binding protein [Blastocatellia bacterium]|nr:penicillin-binding protein [Blastocatellia bacterium]